MKRVQLELFSFHAEAAPKRRVRSVRRRAVPLIVRQLDIIEYLDSMNVDTDHQSPFLHYNGGLPFVASSETSREAASSMKGQASIIRTQIHRFIQRRGSHGATCDEVEAALDLRHQTASARCRELVLMGYLGRHKDPRTEKPIRRRTRSGRAADVLFAI